MIETTDAEDAWCPPTFDFSGFGRTLLAWWIMSVESQRTRRSISWRTPRSSWEMAGFSETRGAVLAIDTAPVGVRRRSGTAICALKPNPKCSMESYGVRDGMYSA